jgi:hypothetical protein
MRFNKIFIFSNQCLKGPFYRQNGIAEPEARFYFLRFLKKYQIVIVIFVTFSKNAIS